MLCAIALGGFVICIKGLYRESNPMLFGGWLATAAAVGVGTAWIILNHVSPALSAGSPPPAHEAPGLNSEIRLSYRA
jgi:hypothetical protein